MKNIYKRHRRTAYFLLSILIFIPLTAHMCHAKKVTLDEVIRYVQKRYDTTEDITATFTQETYSPGAVEPVMASGRVFFKRPEMMRWEYERPEPQLIVTSGKEVYVYEKEARQVMVLPRERFLSSAVSRAFFFGKGSLRTYFDVSTDEECGLETVWCLRLIPKKECGTLKELRLVIDPRTHLIQEMWISDELSSRTHIRFRDIRVNQHLSPDLFRFEPPAGVEVYRAD